MECYICKEETKVACAHCEEPICEECSSPEGKYFLEKTVCRECFDLHKEVQNECQEERFPTKEGQRKTYPKAIYAKSLCCNSDVIPSKGSYAGETFWVCWRCGQHIPKPDIRGNSHLRECQCEECAEIQRRVG